MKKISLRDYQLEALHKMKNGCVLCGDVGSGKSLTAISYYYLLNGGDIRFLIGGDFQSMKKFTSLYIITTARKRDTLEWESEMAPFLLSTNNTNPDYPNVYVDSWNNIGKYIDIEDAFFIFDEQRVVGKGAWVKSFLKITKKNKWILLSATPGDTWSDYIPVFIANGFYKNRSDFYEQHVVWSHFTKWPSIQKYLNQGKLIRHRDDILVDMDFKRQTVPHHEYISCDYDRVKYRDIIRNRIDPFELEPIENASQLCFLLRKVVNSSDDRQLKFLEICEKHPKIIVFYSYDYELDILKNLIYMPGVVTAEWNGHKHEPIPKSERWIYFVQYTSGSEGWNCIETDTIVFFSQHYSYRTMKQSSGRIDRLNTPYHDLYYYHLTSMSPIDISIKRAVENKKTFNENRFVDKYFKGEKK